MWLLGPCHDCKRRFELAIRSLGFMEKDDIKTIMISRGNKVCCSQDVIVASENDSELVVYFKGKDFIMNELCYDMKVRIVFILTIT
jgi:hypothetical protein